MKKEPKCQYKNLPLHDRLCTKCNPDLYPHPKSEQEYNTKCPCGKEAEVLRPTIDKSKRQVCGECFDKEQECKHEWHWTDKSIEGCSKCGIEKEDIESKQSKCGKMILTPHYDNGHNGGMWCAEKKPCKFHDNVEQEVPEIIKEFREKFYMFEDTGLDCDKKDIKELEQFILQSYQTGKEEGKRGVREKITDRNLTTIYYGKVMAGPDNPMVSLNDLLNIL